MDTQKEVLRILLKHYTKIGLNGGIAEVIFDDNFENVAEEIVKLFAIPGVIKSVCEHCGEPIEHPLCRNCDLELTMPDNEY